MDDTVKRERKYVILRIFYVENVNNVDKYPLKGRKNTVRKTNLEDVSRIGM